MEPKETYLLIATTKIKAAKAISIVYGDSKAYTPAAVATPFPPLNFK